MGRHRRAFTLIEVLVVVSIIGLLTAILMPSFRSARRQATKVACAANLRSVAQVLRIYLNESRDVIPLVEILPSIPTNVSPWPSISDVLRPYIEKDPTSDKPDRSILQCPADLPGFRDRGAPNFFQSYYESEDSSYMINWYLRGKKLLEVVREKIIQDILGGQPTEEEIWVLRDYEKFHDKEGKNRPINYMYIDGHVGDLAR